MDILAQFLTHLVNFVHHLSMFQMIVGGVIALLSVVATGRIVGLFVGPILAVVAYIAAGAVIQPLMQHTPIVMPVFDKALLHESIYLYVAFFVVVVVVFVIKKTIMAVTR